MDVSLGKVVEKELGTRHNRVESQDNYNCNYDRFVFTNCKNVKPEEIQIWAKPRSPDWHVGFFNAYCEVYFDKIVMWPFGRFSSIVRNYWQNGKEGEEKKEGYYGLIKSVKKLVIRKEHVNDLIDYAEGRYEVGEHWQLYELDKNIELKISEELEETTVERFQKYFNNIWCNEITADLKTVNNITCNCNQYKFRNCKGVMPQKLVINATVIEIYFYGTVSEVHIPEIVMEQNADLTSIIHNKYGDNKHYSILFYIQTLVIINNPKVLCDLIDYINKNKSYSWMLYQLNKNTNIVIEKPRMTFDTVKKIQDYFVNVLVDNQRGKDYVRKYINEFQKHFSKYGLETDRLENFILTDDYLGLGDQKLNVVRSDRKICQLTIKQKIASQQFICFHDINRPVAIGKIIIEDGGDLRCVLQNAYYNGTDSGFFSLLKTVKELCIYSNQIEDNQVMVDLADYIEGKYALNPNWKQEELDQDMRITIDSGRYSLSLDITRRLRNYFRDVSIDAIWIPLELENVIDQECEKQYIFSGCRKANPQKLVVNAKQAGSQSLILFNDADGEICISEITIGEYGSIDAIVRNYWQNCKVGIGEKYGYYSIVEHVETFTIMNNLGALKDFVDYVVGKYEIGHSNWKLQQLSKDIKVVIKGHRDTFLIVLRISNYFNEVVVDGKQPENYLSIWELWDDPDYKAFRTCFGVHGLYVEPQQYCVEFQNQLEEEEGELKDYVLDEYVYNVRKSTNSIYSLTIEQKLNINHFICFHDINKAVTVNKIVIEQNGDLRSVLQNAYYSNGQGGFFSLLKTARRVKIHNNKQAVEDLADYVDGKYALHPKWGIYALDKNMEIKLYHNKCAFSLDVVKRLRKYFKNVSINCIWALLETENVIDQNCENKYIFVNCKNANPQRLVVNAKLKGHYDVMIEFNDADGEICIPEITISEHGSFDTIVCNVWWNRKNGNEEKWGYYSLISHVETLTIQNNPEAVRDLDNYVSGNYKTYDRWKVQKLSENIIVRINSVEGLDEQINRLKEYFGYIFVDDRKVLGTKHSEAIVNIKLDGYKIYQQSTANDYKRKTIVYVCTDIEEMKHRIDQTRARLGRRRARFQEYLALAE